MTFTLSPEPVPDPPIDFSPSFPAMGEAVIGGAFSEASVGISSVDAVMLQCCGTALDAAAACVFGSATWDAEPLKDGDGLARYYPLWLNARRIEEATRPVLNEALLATLRSTGRDIAHDISAAAAAAIHDGVDGKMCEIPEQFRLARFYEVPLAAVLDPQPSVPIGDPAVEPPVLQWEWSRGFTASMLYRYRPVRQEQSLFSLSPAVRYGVSWLGELTIEVTLENGDKLNAWSAQRLSSTQWSHIAFTFDPQRSSIAMHLNGSRAVQVALSRPIAAVDGCYIGRWNGGSLMNGDAQDFRIYDHVKRNEFIAAEVNSYCADWVEVA